MGWLKGDTAFSEKRKSERKKMIIIRLQDVEDPGGWKLNTHNTARSRSIAKVDTRDEIIINGEYFVKNNIT